MSWFSAMMPAMPGADTYVTPEVERLARQLANNAGKDWDRLSHYPGVERNGWRNKAKRLLQAKLILDHGSSGPARHNA